MKQSYTPPQTIVGSSKYDRDLRSLPPSVICAICPGCPCYKGKGYKGEMVNNKVSPTVSEDIQVNLLNSSFGSSSPPPYHLVQVLTVKNGEGEPIRDAR